ncbi:multiple sugar transport system permease protein/raffinose/stachyose/melibiose transport system permease protein [Agromyces cerinus]|uniref:carbohydrate ABC transporter permease n=1 Tax=Agromyces cerinus TaxID=33878 RepID=UPI0027DC2904|nr:carbohydrate ABC transporter permease [Agromyces cerinus]MBM7831263.1 multiple sugar transport system permease protein/raffinose/stachyose/melibiose transport system permease protein [Agromyces cerinus]
MSTTDTPMAFAAGDEGTTSEREAEIILASFEDPAPRRFGPKSRRRILRAGGHLVAAWLVTLAFVLPIYIALSSAFKSQDQILANPLAPPAPFTFDNILTALQRPDQLVQSGLMNSILVTALTLIFLIPLASALSFWISERPPVLKGILLAVFALGLMVPPQVVLQPIVSLLQTIGLQNSYPGLILSNIGGGYMAFAVFVFVGFLRTLPSEVIEAARVDGAGDLRIWWTIVMPLMRPATATVGIFLGLWVWNDFLNPLFILGPLQGQTITTGIYQSLGTYSTDYGQLFGIMLLAAIIPVVGYLVTQREFIHGLMSGASKG